LWAELHSLVNTHLYAPVGLPGPAVPAGVLPYAL